MYRKLSLDYFNTEEILILMMILRHVLRCLSSDDF